MAWMQHIQSTDVAMTNCQLFMHNWLVHSKWVGTEQTWEVPELGNEGI
jgi:hypothetical protein